MRTNAQASFRRTVEREVAVCREREPQTTQTANDKQRHNSAYFWTLNPHKTATLTPRSSSSGPKSTLSLGPTSPDLLTATLSTRTYYQPMSINARQPSTRATRRDYSPPPFTAHPNLCTHTQLRIKPSTARGHSGHGGHPRGVLPEWRAQPVLRQ